MRLKQKASHNYTATGKFPNENRKAVTAELKRTPEIKKTGGAVPTLERARGILERASSIEKTHRAGEGTS